MYGRQRSLQELVRSRLAYAFLSLADFFISIFPESEATRHPSPHSCLSAVELSSGGKIPTVMGREVHPGRQTGSPLPPLPSFGHGWPAPPWALCSRGKLAGSRICLWEREEMNNKEHHGKTHQPRTSWVPLALREGEAQPQDVMSPDWGKGLGGHFLHPSMGVEPTTT